MLFTKQPKERSKQCLYLPSAEDLPYKIQPRFSTSDIPNTSFQNINYTINIPHPIYINLQIETIE